MTVGNILNISWFIGNLYISIKNNRSYFKYWCLPIKGDNVIMQSLHSIWSTSVVTKGVFGQFLYRDIFNILQTGNGTVHCLFLQCLTIITNTFYNLNEGAIVTFINEINTQCIYLATQWVMALTKSIMSWHQLNHSYYHL